MDKVKINKAIDALGLSVNHKNTLKEALNQGAGEGMVELETKVDDIDKEIVTVKNNIADLGIKVDNFVNANEIVNGTGPYLVYPNMPIFQVSVTYNFSLVDVPHSGSKTIYYANEP